MKHETIYKYDQAGRLRVWWIEASPSQYRTHAGLIDGAITTSEWTHCQGNQQRPDAVDQCAFEVAALYAHNLARTYHTTPEQAKFGAHHFEPMLAQPLDRKRLPELAFSIYEGPHLYIQPKLDGMRCIATADGMFSRQGKEIISAPHIAEALKPYFDASPSAIIDGELYSDKLADDFSKIMSLARKTKPSSADLRESARYLEFHIYDRADLEDAPYAVRQVALIHCDKQVSDAMPFGKPSPVVTVQTEAIHTMDQWDQWHAKWIGLGYEGSIGRAPSAPYQNKRTHDLIKRKDFDDAEFQVAKLGEGEGNWAGACKRVYCWLSVVPLHERVAENISELTTFIATPKGTHAYLSNVLTNPALPDYCTVQYFGLTTTDNPKPRHPIAKQLHWGVRDD
jgi:DNA ligase-1